jgi:hypothetical protein
MSSIITSIFAIMTLFLLQYFHYLPKVSIRILLAESQLLLLIHSLTGGSGEHRHSCKMRIADVTCFWIALTLCHRLSTPS